MEVFPTHFDRTFVKIIKHITGFGVPILGPMFPLWAALFSLCGLGLASLRLLPFPPPPSTKESLQAVSSVTVGDRGEAMQKKFVECTIAAK